MPDVSDESERKTPRELSEEELGSLNIELAVRNIREGNPDLAAARAMLRIFFCARAKELHFPESPFPDEYLALLISAFERYLSGEKLDIEKSLGLKRGGRPPDPKIHERNVIITMEVMHLESEGRTVTDSRKGEGAFAEVAANHNLSESQVRDIYSDKEKQIKIIAEILTNRLKKSDSV